METNNTYMVKEETDGNFYVCVVDGCGEYVNLDRFGRPSSGGRGSGFPYINIGDASQAIKRFIGGVIIHGPDNDFRL